MLKKIKKAKKVYLRKRGPKKKIGPKFKDIDWHGLKALMHCQCTNVELAAYAETTVQTLYDRCPIDNDGMSFVDFKKMYMVKGKSSLRRELFRRALSKSEKFAALKFALINYTDLADKKEVTIQDTNAVALTDEEQEDLKKLALKKAKEELSKLKNVVEDTLDKS